MRLVDLQQAAAQTSGEGKETSFGFSDPRIIFTILRDKMYSNPRKAAIQEYVCNARDAHREAKIEDRPILVTFPDYDGSEIVIRDYGLGIPQDKMENVFCKYGASTKRNSDRFTGGWGLGCKTGFAIGDTFGVTSITNDEDGVRRKRIYICYLDDGAGTLRHVSEEVTDEETGLAIQLPVEHTKLKEYAGYLETTCQYWSVRPIVEGYDVEYEDESFYATDPAGKWAIQNHHSYQGSRLVVDGIQYPFRRENLDGLELSPEVLKFVDKKFVLWFQTGELTPTPNRESIQFDLEAKLLVASRLEDIGREFFQSMSMRLGKIFDDETNPLKLRMLYDANRDDLTQYAPGLKDAFKSRLVPREIRNLDYNVAVWEFEVRQHDVIPVGTPKQIYQFQLLPNSIYIDDDTSSSKPTRPRVYGLYEHVENNRDALNPSAFCLPHSYVKRIYVFRYRGDDVRKKFFEAFPKLTQIWHSEKLSKYIPKALGGQPTYRKARGGGTEVRALNRARIANDGLYTSFMPFYGLQPVAKNSTHLTPRAPRFEQYGETRTELENLESGVYVVLNNSKCFNNDGWGHKVELKVYKKSKISSPYDDTHEEKSKVRKVVRFRPSVEVVTADVHAIPDAIPIFGVFEAGWNLIKNNPKFISVADYHMLRRKRFERKYQELISRGRVFFFERIPSSFDNNGIGGHVGTELAQFLLASPRHLMPSPELKEWWNFHKQYPNFKKDFSAISSNNSQVPYHFEGVLQEVEILEDNRLNWLASALANGKMTHRQKKDFLALLHTNTLKA